MPTRKGGFRPSEQPKVRCFGNQLLILVKHVGVRGSKTHKFCLCPWHKAEQSRLYTRCRRIRTCKGVRLMQGDPTDLIPTVGAGIIGGWWSSCNARACGLAAHRTRLGKADLPSSSYLFFGVSLPAEIYAGYSCLVGSG